MAGFQPPHHRQPAAAGRQAQGPALQVGPPAQVITQLRWAAGQRQLPQPAGGIRRSHGQGGHAPGPPLHCFRDRFTSHQRQAIAAAGQGQLHFDGLRLSRQPIDLFQPSLEVARLQRQGVQQWRFEAVQFAWFGHAPGIRPEGQMGRSGVGQPNGVQQAHGCGSGETAREAISTLWACRCCGIMAAGLQRVHHGPCRRPSPPWCRDPCSVSGVLRIPRSSAHPQCLADS